MPDPFEEEAVLHAAPVAKVVALPQGLMQLSHTQGEGLPWQLEVRWGGAGGRGRGGDVRLDHNRLDSWLTPLTPESTYKNNISQMALYVHYISAVSWFDSTVTLSGMYTSQNDFPDNAGSYLQRMATYLCLSHIEAAFDFLADMYE